MKLFPPKMYQNTRNAVLIQWLVLKESALPAKRVIVKTTDGLLAILL